MSVDRSSRRRRKFAQIAHVATGETGRLPKRSPHDGLEASRARALAPGIGNGLAAPGPVVDNRVMSDRAARAVTLGVSLVMGAALLTPLEAVATPEVSGVVQCGNARGGFVVYANGVTCPTAKRLVSGLSTFDLNAWQRRQVAKGRKLVFSEFLGYRCIASYQRASTRQLAGSCLKLGTSATGFGWTRDGARVPLPPGADRGSAG
jgi:hypothetical protein